MALSKITHALATVALSTLTMGAAHAEAIPGAPASILTPVEPSDVAQFAGAPEEMGVLHGRAESAQIESLINQWLKPKLAVVPILPYIFADWKIINMWSHIPTAFKDEMRGVSDGSGIPYSDVVIANTIVDIAELTGHPFGCSVFAVRPDRSATGAMLVGRNLDYGQSEVLRDAWRPVLYARTGAHKVLGIELPGYLGTLTSINDAGVFIARLTSYNKDVTSKGTPTTMEFREILSQAGSAKEAVALWQASARTVAINVMIADGKDAFVVESTASVTHPRTFTPNGTLVASNWYESPDLQDGVHGPDARGPVLAAFDQLPGKVGVPELAATLCAAGGMPDEPGSNLLGVMVDYAAGRLYYATGAANSHASCAAAWQYLDLKSLIGYGQ